jgi:Domain of unknown function (DUF1707)
MVATRPDLRVGDAERDTTATLLREHYAQGRLSTDELNERLDATFSATTQGQLAEITHDLPRLTTAAPQRQPPAPVPHHHHGRALAKVVTLLVVAAMVLGVAAIAHGAGSHGPRAIAELLVLLLVLRAVAGRHAGRRHWEHQAARYGSDGYGSDETGSDGYGSDETGSDGFSGHRHQPGHPGGHFHEHHHEHHHSRNGHSYRYSYDYEWSDGFDRRDASGQSGRVQ